MYYQNFKRICKTMIKDYFAFKSFTNPSCIYANIKRQQKSKLRTTITL